MWKEKQHIKECWKLLAVTLLQILERNAKVAENFFGIGEKVQAWW